MEIKVENQVEKPIAELLQEVRYELYNSEALTKKGLNSYQGFKYFELEDFLPLATKLFYEKKLCPTFNIKVIDGVEYAIMDIYHGTEKLPFMMPTAEAINSNNPIQNQGSKASYLRRYVYLSVLDLCESDPVDSAKPVEKKDIPAEPKATKQQLEIIRDLYDEESLTKMLERLHINNLEEMTLKDASTAINWKKSK